MLILLDGYNRYPLVKILNSATLRSFIQSLDMLSILRTPRKVRTGNGPCLCPRDSKTFPNKLDAMHSRWDGHLSTNTYLPKILMIIKCYAWYLALGDDITCCDVYYILLLACNMTTSSNGNIFRVTVMNIHCRLHICYVNTAPCEERMIKLNSNGDSYSIETVHALQLLLLVITGKWHGGGVVVIWMNVSCFDYIHHRVKSSQYKIDTGLSIWCPDSSCPQIISTHDIDYVKY